MRKHPFPEPTFSVRLLHPFLDLLREQMLDEGIQNLDKLDPDTRIPIRFALHLLEHAVLKTDDPDLGLRAARTAKRGDYELLEYTMLSSKTVREAHEVLRRYVHIVNSALDYSIDIQGPLVISRFSSRIVLSRAASDFQIAAVYLAAHRWLPAPPDMYREVWFTYPEPPDTREHLVSLPGATLRFGAPFDAILCDRAYLDLPMPRADAKLHRLLRTQLEERVAELPPAQRLRRRVRGLIAARLSGGSATAEEIAATLQMSRRTLTRRLVEQGITFKELLEEVRRELAERALISEDVSLGEIAQRIGFSEPTVFHRAFKRWTGLTATAYRERNWRGEHSRRIGAARSGTHDRAGESR
jgi:AraC-like DNA-binding protein